MIGKTAPWVVIFSQAGLGISGRNVDRRRTLQPIYVQCRLAVRTLRKYRAKDERGEGGGHVTAQGADK